MLQLALIPILCLASALVVPPADQPLVLDDTYLVKFKDKATSDVIKNHTAWIRSLETINPDGTVARGIRHEFSLAFDGYSAVLDKATLKAVRRSPEVAEISTVGTSIPPQVLLTPADNYTEVPTASRIVDDNRNPATVLTENNKGWNANRISHRRFAPTGYNNGPWIHNGYLGQGVNVYILDTGLNLAQPGFGGSSVVHGKSFVRGSSPNDVNGHGTMCGGVIAGKYAGISPNAQLVNVKIANDQDRAACDDTVAGIEWVVNQPGNNNMKVISMSQTGFTGRPDVSTAVAAAVRKGVHVVVCAGNNDVDACNVEPSNAPGAIVVGSVDAFNKFPTRKDSPEGTNVGRCVTVFAPGSRVPTLSAKNLSPDYHYWAWGTSVAAPQVAALVANRLSQVGPQSPAQIKNWIVATATKGQIEGNLRGSPNLIAHSGIGDPPSAGGVETPEVPTQPAEPVPGSWPAEEGDEGDDERERRRKGKPARADMGRGFIQKKKGVK